MIKLKNKQKNLEKLSFQLIQFIDPTPFEYNGTNYIYADITPEYGDQKKETIVDKDNKKLIKIHIDIKKIIKDLDNYKGSLELKKQLNKFLDERYTPEIWRNWNFFNPMKAEEAKSNSVRNFLTNIYKIGDYNYNTYEYLYYSYIEIISNKTDYNNMASDISTLRGKVSKLESGFDKETEYIENKIKSNVYSEFITILGIFTAITFAIFGGMNLLSNLFKNIGSTSASLGQTLILAAIFGLIMWGIIELLFYWISKIKGITDSTKDKDKKWFNWLAIGVLAIILILGILLFTKAIK